MLDKPILTLEDLKRRRDWLEQAEDLELAADAVESGNCTLLGQLHQGEAEEFEEMPLGEEERTTLAACYRRQAAVLYAAALSGVAPAVEGK